MVGILVLADCALTAPQLIRLAKPLGVSATNVKSHLTRMVAEGILEREGPARSATYRPSSRQAFVIEGILDRLREPDEPWDGKWWMIALNEPKERRSREQLRGALWFEGWRAIAPNVLVRPAWGTTIHGAAGVCMRGEFISQGIDPARLYDLEGLDSAATRLASWVERHAARTVSPRAAFVARMKVGGRVAQFVGHDPKLPPAIWGQRDGMRALYESFRRFEERIAPHAQKFVEEAKSG